jgi:hypothetical protein
MASLISFFQLVSGGERAKRMSSLMIRCPQTSLDVWTGVDTDLESLEAIPESVYFTTCPHCKRDHAWWRDEAWLTDDPIPGESGKRTLAA